MERGQQQVLFVSVTLPQARCPETRPPGDRTGGPAGSAEQFQQRPATFDHLHRTALPIRQANLRIDAQCVVDRGGQVFRRNRLRGRPGGIAI